MSGPEPGALDAERRRAAALEADLEQSRAELARSRAERERWLSEMIAQAKTGDDDPAALAQFISELRGEVIALRARRSARGDSANFFPQPGDLRRQASNLRV